MANVLKKWLAKTKRLLKQFLTMQNLEQNQKKGKKTAPTPKNKRGDMIERDREREEKIEKIIK